MVLALAGCTSSVAGTAGPERYDPDVIAGLPIYDGANGERPGVRPADLTVEGTTGQGVDTLATDAVADVQDYWAQEFPQVFPGKTFTPVSRLVSYDSTLPRSRSEEVCGENTAGFVNAFFCNDDDLIAWDRGELLPVVEQTFSPMSVVLVLAHEYGHSVQRQAGLVSEDDPTIVFEQQADCLAGAYLRHVAEGASTFFTLDTSQGLNTVLAAAVAIRDPVGTDPRERDAHGSSFDRVTALSFGFTDGPTHCAEITPDEVSQRVFTVPTQLSSTSDTGDLVVDDRSIGLIVDSMEQVFPPAASAPVQVDLSGAVGACQDGSDTPPVSYCPATRTIAVEVPALSALGTPVSQPRDQLFSPVVRGDFSAFVLLASRYMLSVQQDAGVALDDPLTGLRSACLAGAWAVATSDAGSIRLSPGDLDEAVSGLLSDSTGASDVRGNAVRSGFARVEALRTGVLQGRDACFSTYL
ncbi:zinc metallopeptidase LpqM [Rhodococcus aerolatus]